MIRTKNDLATAKRKKLIDLIQQQLVDLINLQLQAKQAHWNVKGPQFHSLHELFDSVAAAAATLVDEVAERAVALGGVVDGTIEGVAKKTTLKPYRADLLDGMAHVETLSSAIAAVGKGVRAAIAEAEELEDPGTADLFTGASRELDKQLWFVEAHQQGGK